MKRGYTALEYKSIVRRLRAARPGPVAHVRFHRRLSGRDRRRFRADAAARRGRALRRRVQLRVQPASRHAGRRIAGPGRRRRPAGAARAPAGAARRAIPGLQRGDGGHAAARARDRAAPSRIRASWPRAPTTTASSISPGDAASIDRYVDVDITAALPHSLRGELDGRVNRSDRAAPLRLRRPVAESRRHYVHVVLPPDPASRRARRRLRHCSCPAARAFPPPTPPRPSEHGRDRRRCRACRGQRPTHRAQRCVAARCRTRRRRACVADTAAAPQRRPPPRRPRSREAVRRRRQGRARNRRDSSRSGRRTKRSGSSSSPSSSTSRSSSSQRSTSGIGEGRIFGGAMTYPVGMSQIVVFHKHGADGPADREERQVHGQGRHAGSARGRRRRSPTACSSVAPIASQPHPERKSVLIEANALLLADIPGAASMLERGYRQPYALRPAQLVDRHHARRSRTT